jgi:hypothetical protein
MGLSMHPLIVFRQLLRKYFPLARKELLGTLFSMRSMSHQRKVGYQFFPELLVSRNEILSVADSTSNTILEQYKLHTFRDLD